MLTPTTHIVNTQKVIPANVGYGGFTGTIAPRPAIVAFYHVQPTDKKLLKDGDIINIDVAVIKDDGLATPAACTASTPSKAARSCAR